MQTVKNGAGWLVGRTPLRRCLTPVMVNMHLVLSRQIQIIGILSTPITLLQCPDRPSGITAFLAVVCLCCRYSGRCGPCGNTRGRNVNLNTLSMISEGPLFCVSQNIEKLRFIPLVFHPLSFYSGTLVSTTSSSIISETFTSEFF